MLSLSFIQAFNLLCPDLQISSLGKSIYYDFIYFNLKFSKVDT